MSSLIKIIEVNKDKCINCHKCVSVCPVKFCNNVNGDVIEVNPDLCIGCGSCIKACPHEARIGVDDFSNFLNAASRGQKTIAIAAPAAAANFPGNYLKLNGWLGSLGVQAVFDVSFGAELTVKTYLEYIKANKPKTVIAQPCPAIVTYIEIYKPDLIKYLAPADSPMLHTIKMIKEFYPEYKNHKVVVLSPCFAKKREFEETGLGDYNITYKSIDNYLSEKRINLSSYPEVDYSNDPAERAVLFSSPGGLMRTAEREAPGITEMTRKIEGSHTIYHYINDLDKMIRDSKAPLLIDCLNCEMGCNGGPGTLNTNKPIDEVEFLIEKRNKEMQHRYKKRGLFSKIRAKRNLEKHINRYWKPGLYGRTYKNHSENINYRIPNEGELKPVYEKMYKFSEKDMYNCSACGYDSCRDMAVAIYNGLNKPENCFQRNVHLIDDIEHAVEKIEKFGEGDLNVTLDYNNNDLKNLFASINSAIQRVRNIMFEISGVISSSKEVSMSVSSSLQNLSTGAIEQSTQTHEISSAISQMTSTILETTKNANSAANHAKNSVQISEKGSQVIFDTVSGINKIADVVNQASTTIQQLGSNGNKIGEIIKVIDEIAEQTNLLALNAAIEAARAGEQGRGFAVVADEVRKLADRTTKATKEIAEMIRIIQKDTNDAVVSISEGANQVNKGIKLANESGDSLVMIKEGVRGTVDSITQVAVASEQQSKAAEQISNNIEAISVITSQSVEMTHNIARDMETLLAHTDSLSDLIKQFNFSDKSGKGTNIFPGLN